jgi:hypothetical protein
MGLGITLKVMAGDRIDISGKSYYNQNNPSGGTDPVATIPLTENTYRADWRGGGVVATTSHGAVRVGKHLQHLLFQALKRRIKMESNIYFFHASFWC